MSWLLGIVLGIDKYGNKKGTQKISESLIYKVVAGTGFEPVTFGL